MENYDDYHEFVENRINEVAQKWDVTNEISDDMRSAMRELVYEFIQASAFDSNLQKFGFENIAKIRYQESLLN